MKLPFFRTVLAFAIAPISPGILADVVALPFHIGQGIIGRRELSEAIWIIGLSAVLGYPIAVVLGTPAYFFFRFRGWNNMFVYMAAGALFGFLVYVVFVLASEYAAGGLLGAANAFLRTALIQIPLAVICGIAATSIFWLIARPDHS